MDKGPVDKDPVSLLEYVTTRLREVGELVRKNLQRGQVRMKVWYDQKTRVRTFGDIL